MSVMNRKKPQPQKRIRLGRLQTLQEVARFQARVIKSAARRVGGDNNFEYKLCMMASMLARTLETSDLAKRIEALEALQDGR